jgi:transcription elongation factor GreA
MEVTMTKANYMTQEGLIKLRKELEHLTKVERPAISVQIAEARDKGDLSENAEYDAAKDAQGMLEMKISQLEEKLANARIIDESKIDTETVQIMNRIKIRNKSNNSVMQYMIVSETEADLKAGKLSVSTPIAQALLGKKLGDKVTVIVPSGEVEYEIVEISL